MDSQPPEAERLRQDVEHALKRAADPAEVLPLLHRLARSAKPGTEASVFAHRNLAEVLVERDPWRAALHARKVLANRPDDDRGWAMLALCQTLLGNYRYAVSAYRSAIQGAPSNPWYAHNLGHLLDVALGRPKDAVPWLRTAYSAASWSNEIAASYAHALARTGDVVLAKKVVTQAMKKGASREHAALLRWLEEGAPAGKDSSGSAPHGVSQGAQQRTHQSAPLPARTADSGGEPASRFGYVADSDSAYHAPVPTRLPLLTREVARPRRRRVQSAEAIELEETLARGLTSLPLDAKQRSRAKELARDALDHFARTRTRGRLPLSAPQSLAAAIAYAIVYIDHVPLKPAEVAACFRVSAASLRGRFAELRAYLDLTPGDARYATLRQR